MIVIVILSAEILTVSMISVGRCQGRDLLGRVGAGTSLGAILALVEEASDTDCYQGLQSPEVVDRRDTPQEEVLEYQIDRNLVLLFELGVEIWRIFVEEGRLIH